VHRDCHPRGSKLIMARVPLANQLGLSECRIKYLAGLWQEVLQRRKQTFSAE